MQHTTASLQRRLEEAEEHFLSALSSQDDIALEAFRKCWEALCLDFEDAFHAGIVDDSLRKLAQYISSIVVILDESLFHLQQEVKTASFMSEIDELFAKMAIDDIVEPAPLDRAMASRTRRENAAEDKASSSLPPIIPLAFDWLVENLQNPYPTTALKLSMATQAGISFRSMDEWFKSVRRHIGWVSIVKRHFKGSRALAIAAAERVLSQNGGDTTTSFEIAADLLAMRSELVNLYPNAKQHSCRHAPSSSLPRADSQKPSSFLPYSSLTCGSFSSISELSGGSQSPPSTRPPSLIFTSTDSEDDDRLSLLTRSSPTISHYEFDLQLSRESYNDSATSGLLPNLPGLVYPPDSSQDVPSSSPVTESAWWPAHIYDDPVLSINTHFSSTTTVTRKRRRSNADVVPLTKRPRKNSTPASTKPQAVSTSLPQRRVHYDGPSSDCDTSSKKGGANSTLDSRLVIDSCCSLHKVRPAESCADQIATVDRSTIVNVNPPQHNYAACIRTVPSPTTLRQTPPLIDAGVPELSPEALKEMLDDILSNFHVDSTLANEVPPPLQLPFTEDSHVPNPSMDLPLEQREEFGLLLASAELQLPEFDEALWESIFESSVVPLHDVLSQPTSSS
ncbi:uncharacterized protein PHACADRAFT_131851 [Phanerochaete carnosa HHB-10118-sp]|uniref:KN homeodomain domain-containing protein n=1 Tax=Phanerochaete carnosa (strain HHB-10118-sp) TaxID=650164 RepID=K5VDP7_PHACS|nr:uncharacterized protein PHACADRAFT_131851 [Phanerochaete carnosa HHB-10118-sp]EKM49253.1 hypothetical protein PHACADRAFT_131851 [Phanerochaete carnosa HHB-10118-sp]